MKAALKSNDAVAHIRGMQRIVRMGKATGGEGTFGESYGVDVSA